MIKSEMNVATSLMCHFIRTTRNIRQLQNLIEPYQNIHHFNCLKHPSENYFHSVVPCVKVI